MSIMRFKKGKDNPYFLMHNATVNDQRLSFKAKGFLAYIISKPDYWYVNYNDLVSASTDGIKSVRSTIKELIKAGYLERSQPRSDNGHFGYTDFTVYEKPRLPKSFKDRIAPYTQNGHAVTRHSVKVTPTNTNKKDITEEDKAAASLVVNTKKAADVIPIQSKNQHPDNSDIHKISSEQESLIERKKITLLKLFDEMNIQSSEKLFDSFPLDDIFKYCQWIKNRKSTPDNPTGYLITSLKEKWIEEIYDPPEEDHEYIYWYKCNTCKCEIGFKHPMELFEICNKCTEKLRIKKMEDRYHGTD